jgi:hypothetical protein
MQTARMVTEKSVKLGGYFVLSSHYDFILVIFQLLLPLFNGDEDCRGDGGPAGVQDRED